MKRLFACVMALCLCLSMTARAEEAPGWGVLVLLWGAEGETAAPDMLSERGTITVYAEVFDDVSSCAVDPDGGGYPVETFARHAGTDEEWTPLAPDFTTSYWCGEARCALPDCFVAGEEIEVYAQALLSSGVACKSDVETYLVVAPEGDS